MIYLDHAASTYPYVEVLHLYRESLENDFANPSAAHRLGLEQELKIKRAKASISGYLQSEPDELYFTSGASEAANMALKGYLSANRHSGSDVIISAGEHEAVSAAAEFICHKLNLNLIKIPLNSDGRINRSVLSDSLSAKTALVCTMAVNNETGAINDISAISDQIKYLAPQAKLFVDYVQALNKLPIHLRKEGADMACFAGHKCHAPKGIGLLYVKRGLRLDPLIHGGGHQNKMRSGTENSPLVQAFALAIEIGQSRLSEDRLAVEKLREVLLNELDPTLYVLNSSEEALPWIVNLSFPGLRGETLLHALAAEEIYVSQASSCHSKSPYSKVLSNMGINKKRLESAIRLSFSADQSEEEVRKAASSINRLVRKFKR